MNKRLYKLLATLTLASLCAFATQAQDEAAPVAKPAPAAEAEAPAELPALEIEGRVFVESSAYAGTYSLIDSEAIELSNIQDVEDLSGAVPGLHVTDTNGRSFGNVYTLRGIGNTPLFGTSGVVFYLDDVPQGDPSSINPVLTDLNSIRVYRGPQGHLFGRNSSAGVVSMYSRKPDGTRETKVNLNFGEYNSREYSISTRAPLDNGMSYSFSLGHSERDGYIYNSTLGRYEDERDHTGGRFNLYFKANDVIDVNIGISVDKFDDGAQGFVKITDLDPATFQVTRNNNYFTSTAGTEAYLKVDRDQEWIKLSRNYDWGTLVSITSRLDWEINPNIQDLDFNAPSALNPDMISTIIQSQETWTQEFRFETDNEGPLSWRGGLFYLNTEIDGNSVRSYPSTASYDTDTTLHQAEEENLATFGSFEYGYSEGFNLFGGLRWDRTERDMKRNKSTVQIPYATPTDPLTYVISAATPVDTSTTFSQLTPSLGLSYDVNETTKWFVKTAIGYKPGGYSAYTDVDSELNYEDEKAWTSEIGITLEPNSAWRMVLTGFWSEIEDYQFEKTTTGTNYAITNADEVQGKGLEAELVAQPTENLLISGALGINDMTFEKHAGYEGNRVPFAPRHTLNIAAQYSVPNGYYGRVEYRSVGDTFYDEENNVQLLQEDYSVVNASIGYEGDGYSIRVFGRNLGDEHYYSSISPVSKNFGLIGGMAGSPRLFGVSLSKKF